MRPSTETLDPTTLHELITSDLAEIAAEITTRRERMVDLFNFYEQAKVAGLTDSWSEYKRKSLAVISYYTTISARDYSVMKELLAAPSLFETADINRSTNIIALRLL